MKLIELSGYSFQSRKTGKPFKPFDFSISQGDVASISTDSSGDALTFLKVLATLVHPLQGEYRFKQVRLNFSSYKNLLETKKKIGFISSYAALINNRSVRENLLLMSAYHTNVLSTELDQTAQNLCALFSIENKLALRPAALTGTEYRNAVTVRELIKAPEVLIIEYPERHIGFSNLEIFSRIVRELLDRDVGIVFVSEYKKFIETFSRKKVVISRGTLRTI